MRVQLKSGTFTLPGTQPMQPGWNTVPDAIWEAHRDHVTVKAALASGLLKLPAPAASQKPPEASPPSEVDELKAEIEHLKARHERDRAELIRSAEEHFDGLHQRLSASLKENDQLRAEATDLRAELERIKSTPVPDAVPAHEPTAETPAA